MGFSWSSGALATMQRLSEEEEENAHGMTQSPLPTAHPRTQQTRTATPLWSILTERRRI